MIILGLVLLLIGLLLAAWTAAAGWALAACSRTTGACPAVAKTIPARTTTTNALLHMPAASCPLRETLSIPSYGPRPRAGPGHDDDNARECRKIHMSVPAERLSEARYGNGTRAMRVPPATPPTQSSSPTSIATVPRIR